MTEVEKKLNAILAAYAAEVFLFTGLPLAGFAIKDPMASAQYVFMILPLMAYPCIAFLTGIAAGLCSGYVLEAALLTPAAFLPAYLIFRLGSCGLPVFRLMLLYSAACLLGLLLAFPAYCGRRLQI